MGSEIGIDITFIIVGCVVSLLNFLALKVFLKRRFWTKKTTFLIMNLTIADFFNRFADNVNLSTGADGYS